MGLDGVRAVKSLKLRTAIPIEGQKVSKMKLGHHQRRLLQQLLDHPDFAHGLHTQQVTRKAESLIRMGYIDESWRVTEAGKSRLLSEQQQQQIQESSNEAFPNDWRRHQQCRHPGRTPPRRTAFLAAQLP